MSGGGTTTTQTQSLDKGTQQYVNRTRRIGAEGSDAILNGEGTLYSPETMSIYDQAARFMNPWMDQVVDPVNASFDRALDMSRMSAGSAAQGAGAFGSARHGVAEAVGRGEIEMGRGQVLGNLLNNQWQTAVRQGLGYQNQQRELQRMSLMDPFLRSQMAVQNRNAALGPYGQNTTTTEKTNANPWAQGLGLITGIAGNTVLPGIGGAVGGWLGGQLGGGGGTQYGTTRPPGTGSPIGNPGYF